MEQIGITAGIITLVLSFKLFFDGIGDFLKCLSYFFRPNIISMFKGEVAKDGVASTKIVIWLLCGGGVGYVTFDIMTKIFS